MLSPPRFGIVLQHCVNLFGLRIGIQKVTSGRLSLRSV